MARIRSRYAWRARERMLSKFLRELGPKNNSTALDLGVTPDTSLPESNHFEQRYPWPEQLTAASIEPIDNLAKIYPRIKFQQISPGRLPFHDRQFDASFCSAVIEHVGDRSRQIAFTRELARVSSAFFITTPNRWFPLEFHTITPIIHWLPQKKHQKILRWLGHDFWSKTDNLNLLGSNELLEICQLAAPDFDIQIESISLFGWPSNLIAWGHRRE
jgi:Methyltransferase domain